MVHIGQTLVVGVGVDGGHQTVFNADGLVQRLNQGRQAVGGARGVRNHRICGFEHLVVHAVNDGGVHIFAAWGRDDDFLGAAF